MSKKLKFENLTSVYNIESDKMSIYSQALDYIYSDDDVLNIAITGTYGAGKSSIWKTYKKNRINSPNYVNKSSSSPDFKLSRNWKDSDVIEISLANFRKT